MYMNGSPALWYPAQTHAASWKKAGGPRKSNICIYIYIYIHTYSTCT